MIYNYSLPLWLSLATRKQGIDVQLLSPTMAVLGHKGNKGVRYSCSLPPWLSLATRKQGSDIQLLFPLWLTLATRKQGSDTQLLSPSVAVLGHKRNKGVRYSCSLLPWLSLATRKQGSDTQLLIPTMFPQITGLTWTTGPLTCIIIDMHILCDLFACVPARGTSIYSSIRRTFVH